MKFHEEAAMAKMVLEGEKPRMAAEVLELPSKYACATLSKWADKGWYEWGVTIDLGWPTPEGRKALHERYLANLPVLD